MTARQSERARERWSALTADQRREATAPAIVVENDLIPRLAPDEALQLLAGLQPSKPGTDAAVA